MHYCLLSQTIVTRFSYKLKTKIGRNDGMQFDNSEVGKTIRALRKEKGLSQDVLSGLAGIARTHLTMIENGSKQANFETLWRLATALGLRPSELVAQIERRIEAAENY